MFPIKAYNFYKKSLHSIERTILYLAPILIIGIFCYLFPSLSIKIVLTGITALLAIIDIHHNYKTKGIPFFKSKRTIMIMLGISWFIFTLWDNIEEEREEKQKEIEQLERFKRADSLSIVVSNRTNDIISNIEKSLVEIKTTENDIGKVDSLLLRIKDTLEYQVALLNIATGKSRELIELEKQKIELGKPIVTLLSGQLEFVPMPSDSSKLAVKLLFNNYQQRTAKDMRYNAVLVIYDQQFKRKNFLTSDNNWIEKRDIIGGGKTVYSSVMFFGLDKLDFIENFGMATIIIKTQYRDEADSSIVNENLFSTCRYSHYKELRFSDANEKEKKYVVDFLYDLKMFDFLTDKTIEKFR